MGGALEVGRLRVYAPRGVAADFDTANAHVRSDSREAVSFTLRAGEGFTEVSVQSGSLEVRAGASSRLVKAGESFTTAPDPRPQQNSSGRKRAGIIVAVAAAVALVAIVLTARGDDETLDFGGCVIVPSPGADNRCS
jgi:ferric-dicitrate binding protein FerR (iron transport regulator)